MKTLLLLKLEDINCSITGHHLSITTVDGTVLNLTREAAKELHADISSYLSGMKHELGTEIRDNNGNVVCTHPKTEIRDKDGTLLGSQG